MRGSKTPANTAAKFRAEYLASGNAEVASKKCKIPASTGRVLAQRLNRDPKFVAARRAFNAHLVDQVKSLLAVELQTVHRRILSKPLSPEGIAELMVRNDLKTFHYQDPRPQYLAQQVNAFRALVAQQKVLADMPPSADETPEILIRYTDAQASPGTGTESTAEPGTPTDSAEADGGDPVGTGSR